VAPGAVMSLSPWEEQILDSIKDGITRSEPGLAARLATFTKLVGDEDMPPRENIQASRRAPRRPSRKRRRRSLHIVRRTISRAYQRLGYQRLGLLLWLLISIALVTTAVALNRSDSSNGCTPSFTVACTNPAPTPNPPDSPYKAGG
jgi:hypothetical protein